MENKTDNITTPAVAAVGNNTEPPKISNPLVTEKRDYDGAVQALFSLQSNGATIVDWANKRKMNKIDTTKALMDEMASFCQMLDIDMDMKNVIHVAGTKGKGSTCATIESIIRHQGFTTGLFTSPHLISIRERIKINGEFVDKDLFSRHVWYCFDMFERNKLSPPPYFKFLTLVALRIFQDLNIECTILEVGIGGRADATNIIHHPSVTGITSLGFDHMNVLGDTLPEIAAEKAGIIKTGCPIFTVNSQRSDAMEVIKNNATEVDAPLIIVPRLDQYDQVVEVGLEGDHQKENAALAIAMSNCWIMSNQSISNDKRQSIFNNNLWSQYNPKDNNYSTSYFPSSPLTFKEGLRSVQWPGRAQHIVNPLDIPNLDLYLDGAHTPESSIICLNWWRSKVASSTPDKDILVFTFNSTGGRNPTTFLQPYADAINKREMPPFLYGVFPAIILDGGPTKTSNSHISNNYEDQKQTWEQNLAIIFSGLCKMDADHLIPCSSIDEGAQKIKDLAAQHPDKRIKVLATGSLYLVVP
ncbi:hypothetical protein SAMD00019534_088480, partial [Acytostelium subglobosum LB1]|uniref:hypothetical protein n=1 Tax=Acytostelium subglobosum LB1 TaxID=1410327 RepID=UPI0006451EBD